MQIQEGGRSEISLHFNQAIRSHTWRKRALWSPMWEPQFSFDIHTYITVVSCWCHTLCYKISTIDPGYSDSDLCDTSSIAPDTLQYQFIPHC